MKVCSGDMGTASHVEYLHMKENDHRRDKRRCVYYRTDNNYCAKDLGKCLGSSHCKKYCESVRNVSTTSTFDYREHLRERTKQYRKDLENIQKKAELRKKKKERKDSESTMDRCVHYVQGKKNTPRVILNVIPDDLFEKWSNIADDEALEDKLFNKVLFTPFYTNGQGKVPICFTILQSSIKCFDAGCMYMSQSDILKYVDFFKNTNVQVKRLEKTRGFRKAKELEFDLISNNNTQL